MRIGGLRDGADEPWYVVAKDLTHNHLIVAQGQDHPSLFSRGLVAEQLHWVDRKGPASRTTLHCENPLPSATISPVLSVPKADGTVLVMFDQPQKAVTPGQSAVFYLNEVCLGGGIIDQAVL